MAYGIHGKKKESVRNSVGSCLIRLKVLAAYAERNRSIINGNSANIQGILEYLSRDPEFIDFINAKYLELCQDPNFVDRMKREEEQGY